MPCLLFKAPLQCVRPCRHTRLFLFLPVFFALPASAQIPSLSIQAPAAAGMPAPVASQYHPLTSVQDDLFIGQGTAGPYRLSWSKAVPDSEIVVRNGQTLQTGTDYTIDWASGVIHFSQPLGSSEMVKVSYRCNNPGAERDIAPRLMPVGLSLWNSGQNRLSLSSLLQTGGQSGSGGAQPFTALQFQGGANFLPGGKADAALFVDLHGGAWLRRSGMELGWQDAQKWGSLQFHAARAGTLFTQQGAQGLAAGLQDLNASAHLTPNQRITLDLQAESTDHLQAAQAYTLNDSVASSDQKLNGTLALTLNKQNQITASRLTDTSLDAAGKGTAVSHDSLQFTTSSLPNSSLRFFYDAQASQAVNETAPAGYTQSDGVDLTAHITPHIALSGSLQNQIAAGQGSLSQQLSLTAAPIKGFRQLTLDAALQDNFTTSGAQRDTRLTANLPLLKEHLSLGGGVEETTGASGSLLTGLVNATAQPLKPLQITASAQLRSAAEANGTPNPFALDTYAMTVAYSPLKQLQITGSVTRNPLLNGQAARAMQQQFGVQAQLGSLTLKGTLGMEEDYFSQSQTDVDGLNLGLQITRADVFSAGLNGHNLLTGGTSGDQTFQLGFTHKIGTVFDFSVFGSMTQYRVNGMIAPQQTTYSAKAQLGIHF